MTSKRKSLIFKAAILLYDTSHTFDTHNRYMSDIVVERLALLPRIREIPVSNLGPETGYPDSGF
jgi:hypothetical protein